MNRAGGEAREERPAIYRVTTRRADDGGEETFAFLSKGGVDAHLEFYGANSATNDAPHGCSGGWQNLRRVPEISPAGRKSLEMAFLPPPVAFWRRETSEGGMGYA